MHNKKIILYFYFIYSLYIIIIINITSVSLLYMLPSLLITWIGYLFFLVGSKFSKKSIITSYRGKIKLGNSKQPFLLQKSKLSLISIGVITLIFSIIATEFYTGQTPITALNNFVNGNSLYYEYQYYFADSQLSTFTLNKIPYIIMLFFIKFNLFTSYISFILIKKKLSKFDYFYLLLVTLSQVYFSVVRGTNIEIFEITILLIFILLNKKGTKAMNISKVVKPIFLILLMIVIYFNSISARGVVANIYFTSDLYYVPESTISNYFPMLTLISSLIFGYFGFGFYYTATFVNEIWFGSFPNFIAGLFPKGYENLYQADISNIINEQIELGARWHPDLVNFINDFGLVGLLAFLLLLGYVSNIKIESNKETTLEYLLSFMIFLQMLSFPVGNFIMSSSSNKLIVLFLLAWVIWKKSKKRIVVKTSKKLVN